MIIALFLALFAAALFTLALLRPKSDADLAADLESDYAAAMRSETSQVGRVLLSVAKPLGSLKGAQLSPETPTYKALRLKLHSAGNMYGGSVEVFFSVQVAVILLGAAALLTALIGGLRGGALVAVAVIAAALAAWPYNRISVESKKRRDEVAHALPEFVELLLMPVTSGYGLLPALEFTASRLDSVVASEVRLMLQVLASNSADEQEAFIAAGDRLGTAESVTFFTTLYQAYTEGVRVADTLRGQAKQLREQAYEQTRAKLKKIPNTIALMIGLHLLPFLIAVVMLPTFVSMAGM